MITPASDAIFDVGPDAPENDAAWTVLRTNALVLAESGNLLMLGSRAKDTERWMEISKAMVDAAMLARKAADAKDIDALLKASDQIVTTCMRCHEPYRDNGRKMLPGAASKR